MRPADVWCGGVRRRGGLPTLAECYTSWPTGLEHLETIGLVQRERLQPPTPAVVYRLTERGRALETPIVELGRWGGLALGQPAPDEEFRASWFALGMRATFRPAIAAGVDATYEFRIGEEIFHLLVANGEARAGQGPAVSPKLILEADAETFLPLRSGQLTDCAARAVRKSGRLVLLTPLARRVLMRRKRSVVCVRSEPPPVESRTQWRR